MIRQLRPDDWQALRAIRLFALRQEPAAFLSTFVREAPMTEADWRERLSRTAIFAAGDPPEAIAGLMPDGCVVMVYVRPEARGKGHARALMEAIRATAAARDLPRLWLHVAKTNHTAQRLYKAVGYRQEREEADDLILSRRP